MPRKAFTLVELLVVIAIIGLLSTVAVVSLNSSKVNARNTKRVADLQQILKAMDLGVTVTGALPDSSDGASGWGCLSPQCTGAWVSYTASPTLDAYMANYMPQKPIDPPDPSRGLAGYHYTNAFSWYWNGSSWINSSSTPTIEYALEKSSSVTSCPLGALWAQTGTRLQCMIKVGN